MNVDIFCEKCNGLKEGHFTGDVKLCKCQNNKEFKERLENQLRIHWHWLKETDYNNLTDFIMAIHNNNNF